MNNLLSLAYVEVIDRFGQVQGFFCSQPFFLGIDNLFNFYAFAIKKLLRFFTRRSTRAMINPIQPGYGHSALAPLSLRNYR